MHAEGQRFESVILHKKKIFDVLDNFKKSKVETKQSKLKIYQSDTKKCVSDKKVRKGRRWMPWLSEAKKDVISCDKLGVDANNL